MRVGILHPGAMGSALAVSVAGNAHWASEGRSVATRERASDAGLTDVGSLAALVESVDAIVSVCPPHAAEALAEAVSALGFAGLYVDANAVSPRTALRMAERFPRFVDGGIIGGPPAPPGETVAMRTRLYLSGAEAGVISGLFDGSNVDVRVIGDMPGRASAVKAGFAGWTKGSAALLLGLAAYARSQGVFDDLMSEWQESIPELPDRLEALAHRIGRKAWRFEGEMEEIAQALDESGLPDGFHVAAADIYSRLAGLKEGQGEETVRQILGLLAGGNGPAQCC